MRVPPAWKVFAYCLRLLGVIGLLHLPAADAACSRPITVFLTAQLAAVYAAQPKLGLPSLVDAIAQQSGCSLRTLEYPPARAMDALANGQGDMVVGAAYNHELEAIDSFVPMLKARWLLVARPDNGSLPDKLEDFAQNRRLLVGDVRGVPYPPDVAAALDRLKQQNQIDEAVDIEMALSKLLANRDAAVIITATAYIVQLDRIRSANLRRMPQPQFAPAITGFYLSRKSLSDADRATLIEALTTVVAQDLPVKLLKIHFGSDFAELLQNPNPH